MTCNTQNKKTSKEVDDNFLRSLWRSATPPLGARQKCVAAESLYKRDMLIYVDRITNDEILTDALSPEDVQEGIIAVQTTRIVVSGDDVDIGCGDAFGGAGADEGVDESAAVTELNIVANHSLKNIDITAKEYKTLMKAYWKTLKEKLAADLEAAQDCEFSKKAAKKAKKSFKANYQGLADFVKDTVLANFSDYEFYVGESNSYSGFIIPARYIGESVTPTFYYFTDACSIEKA